MFGMTEFDTELCNSGSDLITGLSADVRVFRANGAYPLANGIPSAIGPQIGEMCIPAGFTEGLAILTRWMVSLTTSQRMILSY